MILQLKCSAFDNYTSTVGLISVLFISFNLYFECFLFKVSLWCKENLLDLDDGS